MWDEVRSPDSKRITSSLTRRHVMKGNGTEATTPRRGKSPNNSKARVLNPKEILSRRGFLSKGANPREMLVGVADDNSHKTWNSTRSSKTRSNNTRSSIDTGRASIAGVDKSEGQCPEALYLYC
jgi:hypothetical protein